MAHEHVPHAVPGQGARPGRQVQVQPQRIDAREAEVVTTGAEVVVHVEQHDLRSDAGDDVTQVGPGDPAGDVGVPEVEQHADGGVAQADHEVVDPQRIVGQACGSGIDRRKVLHGDGDTEGVRA